MQYQSEIIFHTEIFKLFTCYLVTGGLPEVCSNFVSTTEPLVDRFRQARVTQQAILNGYFADIAKHSGKVNSMHIERILRSIPAQMLRNIEENAPKFQFNNVVPGIRNFARLAPAIDWLLKAGLVLKSEICQSGEQPSGAYCLQNTFKLFCFDVGLLGLLGDLDAGLVQGFQFGTYKGFFAESFVAQEFLACGYRSLHSWREKSAEVEFLFPFFTGHSVPIEVKSGHNTKAKSLKKYKLKYAPELSFVLSARGQITRNAGQVTAPVYLAGAVGEWLVNP